MCPGPRKRKKNLTSLNLSKTHDFRGSTREGSQDDQGACESKEWKVQGPLRKRGTKTSWFFFGWDSRRSQMAGDVCLERINFWAGIEESRFFFRLKLLLIE